MPHKTVTSGSLDKVYGLSAPTNPAPLAVLMEAGDAGRINLRGGGFMAHSPCSQCGKKIPGKAANGYVSWYPFENQRVSYYCNWGIDCFTDEVYPAIQQLKSLDDNEANACLVCGEAIDGQPEYVFLTLFLPKREQADYDFPVCKNDCWPGLRERLAKGGRFIPDRNARVGAGAQAPTDADLGWGGLDL